MRGRYHTTLYKINAAGGTKGIDGNKRGPGGRGESPGKQL